MSLPPLKNVKKAYVYMIRRHHLLVHEHVDYPEMPLALPGGTLERGEFPNLAARREAEEETGLSGGFGNMFGGGGGRAGGRHGGHAGGRAGGRAGGSGV